MISRLGACLLLTGALLPALAADGAGVSLPSLAPTTTLGPTTTQQAVDRITRSVTRPLPSVAPSPVTGPDTIWVPEHFTLGDVKVPAHWERRLPDGSVYVPPLVVSDPRIGGDRLVPGHVEPSPYSSQAP
jgi:hypothetical protein